MKSVVKAQVTRQANNQPQKWLKSLSTHFHESWIMIDSPRIGRNSAAEFREFRAKIYLKPAHKPQNWRFKGMKVGGQ